MLSDSMDRMSEPLTKTYDRNEFLVSYARQRVSELQTYHEHESKEALGRHDFDIYAYHQGALSVLASFAGLLAPRPTRAIEEVA